MPSEGMTRYGLGLTDSWRSEVGTAAFDDGASRGVILKGGDLVFAGLSGVRRMADVRLENRLGATSRSRSLATAATPCIANRLDASTGEQLWRWEGKTIAESGIFFAATRLATTGTREASSGGVARGSHRHLSGRSTGGGSKEAVILGGLAVIHEDTTTDIDLRREAYIAVVKLDASNGQELWRFQDVPRSRNIRGGGCAKHVLAVAGDASGHVFLFGVIERKSKTAPDARNEFASFVMKLDGETGHLIWRRQNGIASGGDVFLSAATDSTGSVVAAGYSVDRYRSGGGFGYVAVKFGLNGEELWRYQARAAQGESFGAVAMDVDDNVYLAGGPRRHKSNQLDGKSTAIHKLDGFTGQALWINDEHASAGYVLRSVSVDSVTGLVVCMRVNDNDAGGRRFPGSSADSFTLALTGDDTGDVFWRWHSGSDATHALPLTGATADGGDTFSGCTYGDHEGSDERGESVVKFLAMRPAAIAPRILAATPSAVTASDTSAVSSTPRPTDVSEAIGANDAANDNHGSRSGRDDLLVPIVVGVIIGALVLCEYTAKFLDKLLRAHNSALLATSENRIWRLCVPRLRASCVDSASIMGFLNYSIC